MAFSAVGRDATVTEFGATEIDRRHRCTDHACTHVADLAGQIAHWNVVGRWRNYGAAGRAVHRRIVLAMALCTVARCGRNVGVDIGNRWMLAPGVMTRGTTGARIEWDVVRRRCWRAKIREAAMTLRAITGTGMSGVVESVTRATRYRPRVETGVLCIGGQCIGRARIQLHSHPAQTGLMTTRAIAADTLVDHRRGRGWQTELGWHGAIPDPRQQTSGQATNMAVCARGRTHIGWNVRARAGTRTGWQTHNVVQPDTEVRFTCACWSMAGFTIAGQQVVAEFGTGKSRHRAGRTSCGNQHGWNAVGMAYLTAHVVGHRNMFWCETGYRFREHTVEGT